MTPTAIALLGFVAWTLLLLISLGAYRTSLVLAKTKKASTFDPSGQDVAGFGRRLTRAHANCYENLPIAAAVLLYALVSGQSAATDGLAYVFLGARIGQSVTHLISAGDAAVNVRFIFFIVQVVILIIWLLKLSGIIA